MDMLELLKVSIYKSTRVIILLSSVGIFMHAVKTPEVVDLMAPLLLHLMPKSPTQCLLFFTILSPLVFIQRAFQLTRYGGRSKCCDNIFNIYESYGIRYGTIIVDNLRKNDGPFRCAKYSFDAICRCGY